MLEDWQLLDNGSVVGSVKGHPSLNDGDVITTSPLAKPSSIGPSATVVTMTGSEYILGSPMKGTRSLAVEEGAVDRGTVIKTLGVSALVAGGFALGLFAGGGTQTSAIMTIPEVSTKWIPFYETIFGHNNQNVFAITLFRWNLRPRLRLLSLVP